MSRTRVENGLGGRGDEVLERRGNILVLFCFSATDEKHRFSIHGNGKGKGNDGIGKWTFSVSV